ncbi:MAG: hypothetical protein IPK58_06735 [Acidobacteria bacterium]|nr:hypothetical protein [Acidobacteriota bacterium]
MVTPSGRPRRVPATTNSNIYETADSSYAELKINGTSGPNDPADSLTLTVTGTDGTRADYEWKNGAYRCQKITDRNGNYIAINHDANGLLQSVTDTLGRVVSVNYNSEALPYQSPRLGKRTTARTAISRARTRRFPIRRKRSTPTSTGFR